jgi:hypothetical protein
MGIQVGPWVKPEGTYHGLLFNYDPPPNGGNVGGSRTYGGDFISSTGQNFSNPFTIGSWHGVNRWKPMNPHGNVVGFQYREGSDISPRYLSYNQCWWHGCKGEYEDWDTNEAFPYSVWMEENTMPIVGNVTFHMNIEPTTFPAVGSSTSTTLGTYRMGVTTQLTQIGSKPLLCPSSNSATYDVASMTIGLIPRIAYGDSYWTIGNTYDFPIAGVLPQMSWPGLGSFYLFMVNQIGGSATRYMSCWMTADAEYPEYRLLTASPAYSFGGS